MEIQALGRQLLYGQQGMFLCQHCHYCEQSMPSNNQTATLKKAAAFLIKHPYSHITVMYLPFRKHMFSVKTIWNTTVQSLQLPWIYPQD